MAQVNIQSVNKVYANGFAAVKDVEVQIRDGEFVVLVGPSGCGKSTLLRMIAGLEDISSGEVAIGDRVVNDIDPAKRDIAMVFQNYALYPHMTVFDNMAYGLKNKGMKKGEIHTRITEAARMLQLDDHLTRKPRQLSGGQRQRVAMGRAIVREPKVFLFDEPLSNLDAKLRAHMRSELKELHRRLNATFVFVTHDQVEAMSLADRIVILNAGRIEQVGTPMELYHQPASLFVAEFIGSPAMNTVPLGTRLGGMLANTAGTLPAPAMTIGLRPEAILAGPAGGPGIKGHVAMAEALGAETVLHIEVPQGGTDTRLTTRVSGETRFTEGDELAITVDPSRVCWFDHEGRRIATEPATQPAPRKEPLPAE